MTTQYSPILKLALPVQGELSGTWGDVVNDNITSMVEQAIAGRAVINTWSTNSHTLTSANGTTSESRCAMLELTDTGTALSGAGTVICPALSKIYIVKNAAGQNITVKTASGTGILVPNGRTTFLFCDGTNVVEALTHTTSLQLGTSTTVTAVLDEDNMASNSATSLATQQSIKAYVDAQVATSDTLSEVLANGNTTGGTDVAVGTGDDITFADDSKAIFGAGSDLQIYHTTTGNHSIITESGSGNLIVAADNFEVNNAANNANKITATTGGAVTLYHNNASKLATTATGIDVTGTVTSDGLTVAQSSGANILLESTTTGATTGDIFGEIEFKTNDSNSAGVKGKIDSYSEGAVGNGALRLFTGDTTGLYQRMNISSNGDISFYEDTGTTAKLFWDASAESLMLNASTRIGTEILTVNGTVTTGGGTESAPALAFRADSNTGMFRPASQALGFSTAGAEAMRIDSSGNVGIGTSSPSNALHLKESGVATIVGKFESVGTGSYLSFEDNTTTADSVRVGAIGDNFVARSGGSERMRIDSSGNVGIGESSPSSFGNLVVSASNPFIVAKSSSTSNAGFSMLVNGGSNGVGAISTDNGGHMTFDTGATGAGQTERMRIDSSGALLLNPNNSTRGLKITTTQGEALGSDTTFDTIGAGYGKHIFKTDGTERMRIDSSGNVGIGNTVASSMNAGANQLVVGSGSTGQGMTIYSSTSTGGSIHFADGTSGDAAYRGQLVYNHNEDYMAIYTAATHRMRIDSSGNVGIGTSSPYANLHSVGTIKVATGNSQGILALGEGGGTAVNVGLWRGAANAPTTDGNFLNLGGYDGMVFATGAAAIGSQTERMRIDSSGNVLVGTTSTNGYGASFSSNKYLYLSRDGGQPLFVNRGSSDGDIIEFRKDGTNVGSIASDGGSNLIVKGQGNNAALLFNHTNARIEPYTSSVTDLGRSASKFKDLYLSGNANVGGTVTSDGLTVDTGDTGNGINYGLDIRNSASGSSTSYAMPSVSWSNAGYRWASIHGERKSTGGFGGNLVLNTMNTSNSVTKRMDIDYNGDISFYEDTGTTAKFFWDASAESLGIGTTNPSAKLSIKGGAANSSNLLLTHDTDGTGNYSNIRFQYAEGNTSIASEIRNVQRNYGANGASLTFHTDSTGGVLTERMKIDWDGNVGIGTDSPSTMLHLSAGTTNGQGGSQAGITMTNKYDNPDNSWSIRPSIDGVSNTGLEIRDVTDDRSVMAFDGSGNVLINRTSQLHGGRLCLDYIGGTDSGIVLRDTTSSGTGVPMQFANGATTIIGSITHNQTSTSFNTSSDYRLKENVVDLTGASARVNQLNPSRFNFIADADKTVDGFLAHEVADVVPEAVTGAKDAMRDEEYEVTPAVLDEDGNVTTEAVMGTRSVPDYQGIDQSKLVPLLTAALQEALAKIDSMETRLTALEG